MPAHRHRGHAQPAAAPAGVLPPQLTAGPAAAVGGGDGRGGGEGRKGRGEGGKGGWEGRGGSFAGCRGFFDTSKEVHEGLIVRFVTAFELRVRYSVSFFFDRARRA